MKKGFRKNTPQIVTLITDFGFQGEYAGAMKGAILKVNPNCQVVDITHHVPAQDIRQASFILKNTYPYYPTGTVHVVVVDPGVGTTRRPLVLQKKGYFFVGPDNGVFTFILSEKGIATGYELTRKEFFLVRPSDTFHGRDIFAPVAGHLSLGIDPKRFGARVKEFVRLDLPKPQVQGKKLLGQVLWVDSFGNLITNISRQEYGQMMEGRPVLIKGKGWQIDQLQRTYSQSQPAKPLVVFGSTGMLEFAVNCGNAARELGLRPGDLFTVHLS